MKLPHLSAVVYGLSSSTTPSAAYTNCQMQRRYFRQRLQTTAKRTSTQTHVNTMQPFRWFPSSSSTSASALALHNRRDLHYRHNCHHDCRRQHPSFLPFSLSDDKRKHTQQHHQQQRRMVSLSSTSSDTQHNASTDPDANNPRRDEASVEMEITTTATATLPTFRLFYNDVYKVQLPPRHRFPMGKYQKVREMVQDKLAKSPLEIRQGVECDFKVSPLSTFEELSTTHDPTYISRFLEGDQTEREQRNVGFPWSLEGVDRALSSVGGTLAAACFVCDRQREQRQEQQLQRSKESLPRSPPVWAAHIAGGTHHAFYDYGEGFSVFSDMAVAANVVLDRYPDVIQNNILMIDLDVHQGNGNAVLFQHRNNTTTSNNNDDGDDDEISAKHQAAKNNHSDRVFTFSMHCSGNYFSEKQESDLDIELPIGCQDQAYLMTLNHWLKRFRVEHHKASNNNRDDSDGKQSRSSKSQSRQPSSKPKPRKTHYKWDLIFFQAGVDVLDDDRLGRMALSRSAVARRNELVYRFASDLGIPLVICMGGGYPKRDDSWESIIEAHSDVYCGAHSFLGSSW